jgi:O-antigen/teichoic acid export membrane protein
MPQPQNPDPMTSPPRAGKWKFLGRPGIFRDVLAMFCGQAAVTVLGIVQGAILARALSVETMGRYQLVLSYIAIGQICGLPGMNVAINKGALKGRDRVFPMALRISSVFALASAAVIFASGFLMASLDIAGGLGRSLMLVAAFLPLHGLEKYDSVLVGKRKFVVSRTLNVASMLLSVAIVGGTAYLTHRFLPTLAAAFGVRVVMAVIGLYVCRKHLDLSVKEPQDEKEYLSLGWHQTWISISTIIVSQLDRVVMGGMNPALLAMFHVGSIIPTRVKENSWILFTIITNHWGRLPKSDNLLLIRKHAARIVLIGTALTAIIWFAAPFVLRTLYGATYADAAPIAQWLSLPLTLRFFNVFIMNVDIFQDKGRFYARQAYVRQILYVAILIPGVAWYGYWGAIAANIASEAYAFALSLLYFRKQLKGA